ncbi:MAG TPA: GAF domain-containing protein [Candidatus Tumulicola sp.]
MMRGLRIAVVVLIGLFELAGFVTVLISYERPAAEYGFNLGPDGVTIIAVEPGLPAAKAGVVPGDRIVYESLSVGGRLNAVLNEWVDPGTTLQLPVIHQGIARTVALTPVELPWLYGMADLSYAFAGLALGAVSLALVLLRPSRMTWGFALIAPPLLLPEILMRRAQHGPQSFGLGFEIAVALIYALQAAGTMIFASRFPADDPRGLNRLIDRLAVPAGIAAAAVYIYVDCSIWLAPSAPPAWILFAQDYVVPGFPNLAALIALISTYFTSLGNVRSRLAPTLAAFVLLVVTTTVADFGAVQTSNADQVLFLYFAFAFSAVLLALAVAYGVIRHRVIDVNFIVGRTLVYTVLTVFAVSIFTLIEYLFGKLLERGGLATVLEIVAAVIIGLSLNALHGRLDKFIDVVLFRRRHAAEARLERAAATLPHATSRDLVDEMLVAEPTDALDLASAAVFVFDESRERYVRSAAEGWRAHDAAELAADDHLVVRLRAEREPVDISDLRWPRADLPAGTQQPLYAVPIAIGNRVEAIALYGGHSGGEDLDPDERRSLRGLAGGAALAYDHLLAQSLRRSLEKLRTENASLQHVERTLSDIIKQRLRGPGDPA